jgi:transposase-like protein
MNTAADLVEGSVSETLTYYAFPDIHWQKIRTNNPLERIMREIRRRTRSLEHFLTASRASTSLLRDCDTLPGPPGQPSAT